MSDNSDLLKEILDALAQQKSNTSQTQNTANKEEELVKAQLKPRKKSLVSFYLDIINKLVESLTTIKENISKKDYIKSHPQDFLYKLILYFSKNEQSIKKSINEKTLTQLTDNLFKLSLEISKIIHEDEELTEFFNNILDLISTLFESNTNIVLSIVSTKTICDDFLETFTKKSSSRKIIYQLIQKNIEINPTDENNEILLNHIIDAVLRNYDSKIIKEICDEIKIILNLSKKYMQKIDLDLLLFLLTKIMKDFTEENKVYFAELIDFSLEKIIFDEEDGYNKEYLNLLLKLYNEMEVYGLKNVYNLFLNRFFSTINENFEVNHKRYKWLIENKDYNEIILNSLPKTYNQNIITFYFGLLLSIANKSNDNMCILENDLTILFDNLITYIQTNIEFKKTQDNINFDFLDFLIKQLSIFLKTNAGLIMAILKKCSIFQKISKIMDNENLFNDEIKLKLLSLIEKILEVNNEKQINIINLSLNKDVDREIFYRMNLLSIEYEYDISNYNVKLKTIAQFITFYLTGNKINQTLKLCNIIFESLIKQNFKNINKIDEDTIIIVNNGILQISNKLCSVEQNNEIINEYLDHLINFIFKYNMKIFDYKLKKTIGKLFYSKNLVDEKMSKLVIKNLILSNNKNFYESVVKKSIDKNEYFIVSGKLLYKISKIFYKNGKYELLNNHFNFLIKMIEKSELNIKILLNYKFLNLFLRIINDLINIENEKDVYNTTISLLTKISNHLSSNQLKDILIFIYKLFYSKILPSSCANHSNSNDNINQTQEKEEEKLKEIDNNESNIDISLIEKQKNLCMNLLNIIKNGINYNIKNKYNDYLSLSNYSFTNHLIYNMFFIPDCRFNKDQNPFLTFKISLRISSYTNLSDFYLLKIIDNSEIITFTINNKKELIISEGKAKDCKILNKIENINNYLIEDNKFHDFFVIFNTNEKKILIIIDKKEIINNSYNNFNFNIFHVEIGFNFDNITSKIISNNITIVDISRILILNSNYFNVRSSGIFTKISSKDCIKNSVDYDTENEIIIEANKNMGEKIISKFNFFNKSIKLTYSHKLKNMSYDINKYLTTKNNIFVNRYIPYIDGINPENKQNISHIYFLSKNKNICEYYLMNNLCQIQNINKTLIVNKIFDNYNTALSACNYSIVDLLFGFLFLIEKFNEKNKHKFNNKDENYESEFILNLFEIILIIPDQKIKNYVLYNKNTLKLNIAIFFNRNIYLLNNENFTKSFLKLLNEEVALIILANVYSNNIIFENLKYDIQNIILNKINDIVKNSIYTSDEKINKVLYQLIRNLCKILLFVKLELENNEGMSQIELLLNCIYEIIKKFTNNKTDYWDRIKNILYNIMKIGSEFSKNMLNHQNIINENENKDKFFNDKNFISQLEKMSSSLSDFLCGFHSNNSKNFSLKKQRTLSEIDLMDIKEDIEKESEDLIEYESHEDIQCFFCYYLKYKFQIDIDFFYKNIKYTKKMKNFFRNLFLNFDNLQEILGKSNYTWFLSQKESYGKLQNKFYLKENDINSIYETTKQNKIICNYFYDNREDYNPLFKLLRQIISFDNICKDYNFIERLNKEKIIFFSNCLLLNKLHKILCIFILYEDNIKIFTNLFLDSNNKINVAFDDISNSFWAYSKEEYTQNLDEYIKSNEKSIMKNIFNDNQNNKLNGFGNDKYYKFNYKKIHLKKITELYKRSYLHIPNSIEIFTDDGSSFFITVNIENRDIIFEKIIEKLNKNNDILNISKNLDDNKIYLKYSPISLLSNTENKNILDFLKKRKKSKKSQIKNPLYNQKIVKAVIDIEFLLNEACNNWSKNKISNFDYLMLLNTLSGRSLRNLSQYFIFPWILQNFNNNILDWSSEKVYRDLSLPIHAIGIKNLEELDKRYEKNEDEKFHSGTFYSTHAFVSYFLIRQRPFTETHLELQGGNFDTHNRLFNGTEQLSNNSERCLELIPAIYYLPELYMKTNDFSKTINENYNKKELEDFNLPFWSKKDPRKFSLILKKIMENKNVNKNLNLWIDLIFGYKQQGQEAIKNYNVYREMCYELTDEKFEELKNNNELDNYLFEKTEFGYVPKQIFSKAHKQKENTDEFQNYPNSFFDNNLKIKNIKIKKINNDIFEKNKSNIKFNNISDFVFTENSQLFLDYIKTYYQGGITSLSSLMNSLFDNNNQYIKSKTKLIEIFEKEKNFLILNDGFKFLGDNYNIIFGFDNKFIKIIDIKNKDLYFYYLKEGNDITSITLNEKGNRIFIGFSNGNIMEYKIFLAKDIDEDEKEQDYIFPFYIERKNTNYSEYIKNVLYSNNIENNLNHNTDKENSKEKEIFKQKNDDNIFILQKNHRNYFVYNNPHNCNKITLLCINEYHSILLALDSANIIYILSIKKNLKTIHIIDYMSNIPYKIKSFIPLSMNGDFITYSSLNVNLFNINGVPLAELNLLEKEYEFFAPISYCRAVFIYDIFLFTAHKNGIIVIWGIKNKDVSIKFEDRTSYIYNKSKSSFFLPEFSYNYNTKYKKNLKKESELQRKFIVKMQIQLSIEKSKNISFIKLSKDMSYMFVLDNEKDIYIISNFTDIKEHKKKEKSKNVCIICRKELTDESSKSKILNNEMPVTKTKHRRSLSSFSEENQSTSICEKCKQKLNNSENFLYDS